MLLYLVPILSGGNLSSLEQNSELKKADFPRIYNTNLILI